MPRRLWGLTTYLGLAAGLVKTAYAYALLGEQPSPAPAETCRLNQWVAALRDRNASLWLGMSEVELVAALRDLFDPASDRWLSEQKGPLGEAARSYVESKVYRCTHDLLLQRFPSRS